MGKLTRTQFVDDLKGALVHLYDTEYLRQTHLLLVFHLESRFDASTIFRNILIDLNLKFSFKRATLSGDIQIRFSFPQHDL